MVYIMYTDPMMTDEYIAGFLDGDGFITFHNGKLRRRGGVRALEVRVGFTNTNQNVLLAIRNFLKVKGFLEIHKVYNVTHKPQYTLNYYSRQAIEIIKRVEQHLIIKRPQATLALHLADFKARTHKGKGRGNGWTQQDRNKFFPAMQELNRKGAAQ